MNRTKWKVVVSLLLALLLFAVLAARSDPRFQRRAQVLGWKFSGSLPYVSWPETFRELLPGRWKYPSPAPGELPREIGRGEDPCPVLWGTPLGAFWGQRNDDVTLRDLPHIGRYQRGPVTVRKGDVVFDVGSHIGTFTRVALGQGAGLVVAIEPDPGSNTCFKRTFQQEISAGRVILLEAALWESSSTTKFTVASRSDAGAVASQFDPQWRAVRTIDVPTISVDDVVQRLNLSHVDFIKWAIGEATKSALRGARQTLARSRPRMVMVLSMAPEHPVVLPPLALEAVPDYRVFTYGVELAYFY